MFTWLLGEFESVDAWLLIGFVASTLLIAAISLIDDVTDQSTLVMRIPVKMNARSGNK